MELRKVERKTANGGWEQIVFNELREGDLFKLYNEDDGGVTYMATSDPFPAEPEGNYGIEAELA